MKRREPSLFTCKKRRIREDVIAVFSLADSFQRDVIT